MENENAKPQTGGLKLMTVFVVVLALHVLVIGGISLWHLVGGSSDMAAATPKSTETLAADTAKPADATVGPAASTDEVNKSQAATASNTPSATTPDTDLAGSGTAPMNSPAAAAAASTASDALAATTPAHANPAPAPAFTGRLTPEAIPGTEPALAPAATVKTAATVPAAATSTGTYTVKSGDTLSRIAHAHHMKVAQLRKLNSLTTDTLRVGQKLKVSGGAAAPAKGQQTAGMPTMKMNKAPAAAQVAATSAGGKTYTVAPKDTLTRIAKQFGTTPAAIMAANQISDPHKLRVGMKLTIPGAPMTAVTTPAATSAPTQFYTASE